MKIKYNPIYIAFDGDEFVSEAECREYEEKSLNRILSHLHELKNLCDEISSCDECLFGGDYGGCKIQDRLSENGAIILPKNWDV